MQLDTAVDLQKWQKADALLSYRLTKEQPSKEKAAQRHHKTELFAIIY